MTRTSIAVAAALIVGFAWAPSSAQETAKPEAVKAEAGKADAGKPERRSSFDAECDPGASLRIQLVITRFQNDKKEASLPYTFVVSARRASRCNVGRVRMRMGVDTPVPVMSVDASDPNKPKSTSIQYRNVGTNIDCSADDLADGRYKLYLTVENSSTVSSSEAKGSQAAPNFPMFRQFNMSLEPILRDGQSAQTVAATDPVTGEVVKIDVTMNVVK